MIQNSLGQKVIGSLQNQLRQELEHSNFHFLARSINDYNKSEDISYDKSMLSLKSKSTTKCEPLVSGCSPSDIFEFVAIKSGTTFIKRSHYQTFSNERIDLAVTIKIN